MDAQGAGAALAPFVDIAAAVADLLALPRAHQPRAVADLLAALPDESVPEAWNTAFGEGSLFRAFTRSTVARGVYGANRAVLRPLLDARPGFRVVEAGGGDGSLWEGLLRPDDVGEIVVVDPHPEGGAGVAGVAPPGVRVTHLRAPVERASLPEADAVVCSLTLHHVAGADAGERAVVGLAGPGKREALEAFRSAVASRGGRVLLNEADVYCDVGLAPGDPLLRERLVDSYVRRFAVSLLDDVARRADVDDDVRARWRRVVRAWALGQIAVADAPLAERDVYELDVPSWLRLVAAAGLRVVERRFTDPWMLFHQYVLAA